MMNILCFDTSGPHCSVALATGERIFSHNEYLERRHNESLLSILDRVYESAGITPADTDAIGIISGPGSFTGIRLGAAVAQAIALTSGARVVRLPTHQVLHQAAIERPLQIRSEISEVVCSIKSRGQLYYLCLYRDGVLVEPMALTDELPAWHSTLEAYALVGEAPPWWSDSTAPMLTEPPDAEVMLNLTAAAHKAGLSLPAAHALPEYFAGDSPWRKSG